MKTQIVKRKYLHHIYKARKFLLRLLAGSLIGAALPMAAAGIVQLDGAVSTNAVTSNTSSNTVSLTHTTGTGNNRLTLVGVSWNANTTARTISNVTFTPSGGAATNLTLVRSQSSAATTYRYAAIYALTNPPSGQVGTITTTFSGSVANGIAIGAANFSGVNQTTPLGTSSGAGATSGATISTSLTGLNGNELVFDTVFVGGTPPPTPTATAGQTLLWNTNISNARGLASSTQAVSSSFTDSWTSGDSTRPWAIVAVPINPAAADTTPPTVTIDQAAGQEDPTTNLPINFTVIFSKPVTNFAANGVTLGGTAGATTAVVTGSGTNYNVAVGGLSQSGTVIASIAAGVANDTAGNPNTASTSTDNTVTFVYVPPVTTTLSSSVNPAGHLDTLSFTANIQTNGVIAGDAAGNVIFSANGTPFSTNAVSSGSATSDSINSLPRGANNQITAAYSGDSYYPGSSGSFVEVVTNHPPVAQPVTVTRAANSSLQINLASLVANWSDVDGDTISLAGVNLLTANGVTVLTNGTFIIYPNAANLADQISYIISDGFGGTAVGVINLQISTDTDSLSLTSSAQTNGYLDAVTFTAQVQTNGVTAGDAAGSVVFQANGAPFSTNAVSDGSATSDGISSLPRGTDNIITAVYTGDGVYQGSTSSLIETVTNHPPVAVNVSYGRDAAASVVTIAVSDLLTNVTDADGDTILLVSLGSPTNGGTVVNQSGSLVYSNAAIANDQFSYTVTDGFGGTNTAQINIVVTNVLTVLSLGSSEPVSGYQDSVNFTATLQTNGVTAADATNAVVFSANGTPFSTNTLVAGTGASDSLSSLPRGTNLITAVYVGDDNYPALTNTFSQVVTNHPPLAQPLAVARLAGTSVQIAWSDLATNWSDVDGDAVSLASVSLTTTNGVTVQNNGGFIIYPSAANVADQIGYTISDGFGGTNVGLINITIVKNPTTLALASSSPASGYLSSVSFSASVQTNGVTAGDASGSVVFQANGVAFSTNSVSGGSATSPGISSLPRGTGNIITATYSGDSAYVSSANSFEQTVTNHPPVAGTANYLRYGSNSLTIAVSSLLANVTDADGDNLSLVSVGTSTNGITLANYGSTLFYSNPNPVNDQFTYTVSDSYGGTSTGIVNITEKPVFSHHNILLLIADDLGADGLSLFNTNAAASIPYTPNLTALGQSGVVFTHFYARPSCSQSRACLITGRDSFRTGVGCAISGSTTPSLRTNEYTLPRAFATNAPEYGLASFGKYHLSVTTDLNSPWTTAGWSNFAGFFSPQVSSYFNWTKISNGISLNSTAYTTSDQVNDATNFITQQGTNRWFVWLAFNAPHLPRHLPPTNLLVSAKYLALSGTAQDISANGRSYWEAMVQAEDTEIGRLLKVVDTNDTDIIFLGDNGSEVDVQQFPYKNAAVPATTSGNGHAKFTVYEGGARTPLFITGPDVGSPGRYNDSLVNEPDIWATIQELAGIDVAATLPQGVIVDSVSLLPAIQADVIRPTPWVIEEQFNEGTAADGVTLRNDRFKFIHFYNHVEQFYDLLNDPYEYTNLLLSLPLSDVAQANYNAVKFKLGEYQTFANTAYTRNLVSYPQVNNVGYTNGTFGVNALFTQLSANGSFANPNQPGLTKFAVSGTNLNYQVILWRNADLGNPIGWTPVLTNVVTGITNNFLLSTNGWLIDPNASADHNFYRISPYIP
jgi:arylsulfatase A-like enzyme